MHANSLCVALLVISFNLPAVTGDVVRAQSVDKQTESGASERPPASGEHANEVEIAGRSFGAEHEAIVVVRDVLAATGIPGAADRILVRASSETSNASARFIGQGANRKRVIYYNPTFIQDLKKKTGSYWSSVFVLAHEAGHHIAGHLDFSGQDHTVELEADRYAGFILARMGATYEEAVAGVKSFEHKEGSATHPGVEYRVQAIAIGWSDGRGGPRPSLQPGAHDGQEGFPAPSIPSPDKVETPLEDEIESKQVHSDTSSAFSDCPVCPSLVVIPAGEFQMGSPYGEDGRRPDESPQHSVAIHRRLAVGRFEVTFREWDACVNDGGCKHKPFDQGWGRDERPVINVSWRDTKEYTQWLSTTTGKSYRLLTEAEWEYAARAGTIAPFSTGATIYGDRANFSHQAPQSADTATKNHAQTVPVGRYSPNDFGLYDVHGNVMEWVEDCWTGSYDSAPADGSAIGGLLCENRVARGGSWNSFAALIRSAARLELLCTDRRKTVGFRVTRDF